MYVCYRLSKALQSLCFLLYIVMPSLNKISYLILANENYRLTSRPLQTSSVFGLELWYRTRLVLAAFTYKLNKSVGFGLIFSGPIFQVRFALSIHFMLYNCSTVMINQSINRSIDRLINQSAYN